MFTPFTLDSPKVLKDMVARDKEERSGSFYIRKR